MVVAPRPESTPARPAAMVEARRHPHGRPSRRGSTRAPTDVSSRVLRSIAQRLGLFASFRAPDWQRRLVERGLDPLVAHVLVRSARLEDAWFGCPRADWVLEIAVRARVEPALVARAAREVAAHVAAWPLVAAESAETLRAASEAWQRGGLDAGAYLEAMQAELRALVERAPEVDAAMRRVREAERWRQRARSQAAADAYDRAHMTAHLELADVLRRTLTVEALRFALLGQRAHPYR